MTEPTVEQRLAEALAPFKAAKERFVRAGDDWTWVSCPDYTITVGDLRRLVKTVEEANG